MFSVLRSLLRKSCMQQLNQRCYRSKYHSQFINHKRFIIKEFSSNGGVHNLFRRSFASKNYPQHVVVKLPALSPTMELGGLSSWNKNEGDEVSEGDVIAEVETDKATIAVEADDAGFMAKILIPAGTKDIKVGTPICILVDKKEDISAFKDYQMASETGAPAPPAPADVPKSPSSTPPSPTSQEKTPRKMPAPRKPAIDFKAHKQDTGPKPTSAPGLTIPPSPSEPGKGPKEKYTDHPVSNIRAIIAKRLVQSKQQIPHFYLNVEVETTQMEAMRKVLNAELAKSGVKISVNDIIVKASALACKAVPETNSSWMDKHIRHYNTIDISVAVSTPTGLITPIVFDCDTKVLRDISIEIKDLAKRARQGKLKPHEFQGGTFTVSNLGMFGITQFYAIINPPQSCILAVGSGDEKLFMKDSKISTIGVKKYINFCLSCDHRVVDGAVGAKWLQAFRQFMEEPKNMF